MGWYKCRSPVCTVKEPLSVDGFCEMHDNPEDRKVKRKNEGKPKLTKAMLMPFALEALVDIIEHGEEKYGPGTDKGWLDYDPMETLDSLLRHVNAIINGERVDPDSGEPHYKAVVFNAAVYAELEAKNGRS
jgi:hypothetical protein